jgi:hypothetical protein
VAADFVADGVAGHGGGDDGDQDGRGFAGEDGSDEQGVLGEVPGCCQPW